ncbi:hypothetical protein R5R73_10225 [Salinicola sp. LHM]|jgi:hypothetical protein|uniref:hypothetical protein n=1 Tax=Salinicola sp. LHM TaxID=3065298 RepID=UPI002ACD518B|nr:hypothetical protein [Salinicola sp. LHM]WQH31458.1 hypothetical protein R5R73_10225 [Salinicola sp. LHM]
MLKFFFVILALFVIFVAFKLVLEFRRQRKAIRRCEKADVVEGEWDGQSCLIAFVDEKIWKNIDLYSFLWRSPTTAWDLKKSINIKATKAQVARYSRIYVMLESDKGYHHVLASWNPSELGQAHLD